jgi:sulfatase maturation enzyme AslB (radical SAM superfamily)
MYPSSALISISDVCSINCSFCFRADIGNSTISMRTFTRTLSVLHQLGINQVCLTGGEPTHHHKFPDLVKVSSQFGICCSVISAERSIHPFLGLEKLIPQITLSVDTDNLSKIGNKYRQIDNSLDSFIKNLIDFFPPTTLLCLHVTFFRVSFKEINLIHDLLMKYPRLHIEFSPVIPNNIFLKILELSNKDYINQIENDVIILIKFFRLSQSLISFIYEIKKFQEGKLCSSQSLYISADGFIRRCPYDKDLQINVFSKRDKIKSFISQIFGDNPPTTQFYCQGLCI